MRRAVIFAMLLASCRSSTPRPTPLSHQQPEPPAGGASAAAPELRCSEVPPLRDDLALVSVRGTTRTAICRAIRSTAGRPMSEATVDDDIDSLYKTGFFDDVVAVVEPRATGTALVYEVRDRVVIDRVDVVGAPTGLALPAPQISLADPMGMRRGRQDLLEALQAAGYRTATVEFAVQPAGAKHTLRYTVTPGTRTVLGKIRFEGLAASRDAAARKNLTAAIGEPVTEERAIYDSVLVQTALFEDGLLTSHVGYRIVDAGAGTVDLVFDVTEGPAFKLGTVGVSGPRAKKAKDYAAVIAPLKKGTLARRSILADAVKAITAIHAGEQPDVIVIPQTDIKLDKKLIDVTYVVE